MTVEQKTALVCGAGGFIGNHLVNQLKSEGYYVRGIDLKKPDFCDSQADEFLCFLYFFIHQRRHTFHKTLKNIGNHIIHSFTLLAR